MTTKKDLFNDLLDSIISSDSFTSADKARKLKKAWKGEEGYGGRDWDSRGEVDGDSDPHGGGGKYRARGL